MVDPTVGGTPLQRVQRRMSRLTLRRVSPAVIVILIACWAMVLVLSALILTPVLDQLTVTAANPADMLYRLLAPLWLRILLSTALGVLSAAVAAGFVLARTLGGERSAGARVAREVALGAAVGIPLLGLLADQNWLAAAIAAVLGVAAQVWVHRRPGASGITISIGAALAAGVWGVVAIVQFSESYGSWLWPALFMLAACSAAFATFYAIPRAAESRGRVIAPLFRNDLRAWVVALIALGALAVVVLRATLARTLFNELDSLLWGPWYKGPMSWVIAAIVAAMLIWFSLRSASRPYAPLGSRRVIATLAVVGAIQLFVAALVTVAAMVVATFTGTVWVWDEWIAWYPVLSPVLVVFLGILLLLPRFKASAGRAIGLVAVVYLLVPLVLIPLVDVLPLWVSAATPIQVTVIVVPVAVVLALVNVVSRRNVIAPGVIVRLAIVPVLAVHVGLLLPAVLSDLGRVVIVIVAVLSILLLTPPVPADPKRHALDLLASSGTQLLAVATVVLALPSLLGGEAQWGLGLLWLAIPTMAALMITTRPKNESSPAGSSARLD